VAIFRHHLIQIQRVQSDVNTG